MKLRSRFDRESLRKPSWLAGRGLSLRGLFGAFALAFCFAIVAVCVVDALHERNVAAGVARRAAENLAESLAQQASDTFDGVDGALLAVAEHIEDGGTSPAARLHTRDSMAALVSTMPQLDGLIVADARGRFVVSNVSATDGWMPSVSDRAYFRYHRNHPGVSLHISGPNRSKIENELVIFATRRLNHADGSFAGVAIAPIAVSYFEKVFAGVDIGSGGSITLFADDKTLMVRRPRRSLGRRMSEAGLFGDAFKYQDAGSYVRKSNIDGIVRLFAFRRLGKYPLIADVALAEHEYLSDWRSNAFEHIIGVGFAVAMLGVLASLLSAQIGRREVAEKALAKLAFLDGLTRLPNRRQFDNVFEREWRAATRSETTVALLMIDIDNFKAYNDSYGHLRGDDVIILIAQTIAANIVRPADLAARYGGEEFVVILPATDCASAYHVAERIRRAVLKLALPHLAAPCAIASVSVGVACVLPTASSDRAILVEAADRALYEAKRGGRNRTSVIPLERPFSGAFASTVDAILPGIDDEFELPKH